MKYIQFTDKDPRKNQVARMDDGMAQRLIDAGNAKEISAEEAAQLGGAKVGATVSGTEGGRADRADGTEDSNSTVMKGVTGVRYESQQTGTDGQVATSTQGTSSSAEQGTGTTTSAGTAPAPVGTSAPAPAPTTAPAPAPKP